MSEYLTLSEAAKRIPTTSGKAPSTMTVYRWITKGVNGVRLEHRRFGRRIAVTPEALDKFSLEVAQAWETAPTTHTPKQPTTDKPKGRTAAQRAKAIEKAKADLRNAGVQV